MFPTISDAHGAQGFSTAADADAAIGRTNAYLVPLDAEFTDSFSKITPSLRTAWVEFYGSWEQFKRDTGDFEKSVYSSDVIAQADDFARRGRLYQAELNRQVPGASDVIAPAPPQPPRPGPDTQAWTGAVKFGAVAVVALVGAYLISKAT